MKAARPSSDYNVYIYDYFIYLGENNATDFNMRRNSRLNYTTTMITKPKPLDTRVQNYHLYYGCENRYGNSITQYKLANNHSLHFIGLLSSADPDLRVHMKYEFFPSDPEGLLIDDKKPVSMIIENTFAPEDWIRFTFTYSLPYYHDGNNKMYLTTTATDNRGYSFTDCKEYTYFNYAVVEVRRDGLVNPGTIEIENAEYHYVIDYSDSNAWQVYFDGNGCALKALPEPGYKFIGWYIGRTYSEILSNKAEYHYNPRNANTTITARFEPI